MRTLILFGLAVLWPLMSAAEEAPLRSLATADATRGWEAVGRIDVGNRGFCTGTLIAPDIVLTAAHCIFDQETRAQIPAEEFEFLAGWRNGRAAAYRGVRRAVAHPNYVFEGRDQIDRVPYDIAFLELDHPIRLPSIRPFETGPDTVTGDSVGIVSYALDRAEAPSIQDLCHVLGNEPGMTILSCDVDFGSSGAPVFEMIGGEPKIVSVVSAKAEMGGKKVALGSKWSARLRSCGRPFRRVNPVSSRCRPAAGPRSSDRPPRARRSSSSHEARGDMGRGACRPCSDARRPLPMRR
ncbi:MAG: trypsin-like serine protease [Defluviimonas denitrificans]